MPAEKTSLTIEFLLDILLKKCLISKEKFSDILVKGSSQLIRLQKMLEGTSYRKGSRYLYPEAVSPTDVIMSFNIEIPDSGGKILTEDRITQSLAEEVNIPYKKLDPLKLDIDIVTSHIPRAFAQKHLVVPVEATATALTVAVADPFNLEAIESFQKTKKVDIRIVLSSKGDILKIVREFYGFHSSVIAAQKELMPNVDIGNLEQYVRLKGPKEIDATDQHIVNAVEYLLQYAFDQRASDIHIEPKRDYSTVRLRIDGILHYIHNIPKQVHPPIVSRIKMLSRMDIAEKRRPQDGRIKTNYHGKEIELRISTMPVAFGEKVVIRIFDPEILFQELDQLGFYPREYQLYSSFINRSNGIILITGPTGSGKTTTLYSSLKLLSSPEINIVTIEDPIEMVMEEFNQIGVQSNIGITFANSIRTILRQDPDIIMVGEIRDKETAENAVQAALTGHLVLSTLHTNDAPSAITRLLDLGIPAFLISSTLIGVVAQRLVRKICQNCIRERPMRKEEMEFLKLKQRQEGYKIRYGEGCTDCRGTGYKGRTGAFEIMDVNDKIKSALTEGAALSAIQDMARSEGMTALRESAIRKMLEGITTYEEVIGVIGS
ncbi:MAG: type II secretion system protein E [Deltaproteobacteria bacterium GWC2_42_11]|nr:MAG: type II secretion system protein E [Deltaproteobacteria bacterium GWC2_42_11]HBO83452.1 type II secretion system protein E [Deltaproteobacteria bacterium]